MGQATYSPPRGADDPEIQALVAIFSHGEGLKVLHETIQYLVERSQDEDVWLKALAAMDVPDDVHLGRLRHGLAAPGRELRLERVHDDEARPRTRSTSSRTPTTTCRTTSPTSLVETILHALDAPGRQPAGCDRAEAGIAAAGRPL